MGSIKALPGTESPVLPSLLLPCERSVPIKLKAQIMSRLVECVPNFSEGNNQEVRCQGDRWGAAQGARSQSSAPCGFGTIFSQKGPPPISRSGMHAPPPHHSLSGEHCCYPHVAYEETEAQRVGWATEDHRAVWAPGPCFQLLGISVTSEGSRPFMPLPPWSYSHWRTLGGAGTLTSVTLACQSPQSLGSSSAWVLLPAPCCPSLATIAGSRSPQAPTFRGTPTCSVPAC